jgi:methyltransferase
MVSQAAFTGLVLLVAMQRLFEVRRSRRHEAALRAAGAREHAAWQVPVMAGIHTLWLVGATMEVWVRDPATHPLLAGGALAAFGAGQALRLSAMHALGPRWTIRVMTLPGLPPVRDGIYRYLRHPNYVGVVLEIAALPLVHGAVRTAVAATIANGVLLFCRVRAEERALARDNNYFEHFGRGKV